MAATLTACAAAPNKLLAEHGSCEAPAKVGHEHRAQVRGLQARQREQQQALPLLCLQRSVEASDQLQARA